MNAKWIKIRAQDGAEYDAHQTLPPAGSGPGLLLFPEMFGVNEHIRTVAMQYALDGYVVLVPDIFWRQTPRVELGYHGSDVERGKQLIAHADVAAIAGDTRTTLAALRAMPELTGPLAALGFCIGGRLAYLAAADGGVDAAVCYYGGGIQDHLDRCDQVGCAIQFHFGALDPLIPAAAVAKIAAAFADKEQAELHVYPEASHGFNCWARSAYHQPSSSLAHAHTLRFLNQHLRQAHQGTQHGN